MRFMVLVKANKDTEAGVLRDQVNGPSMTVFLPPENLTRAPLELGWSPSPASMTPALTSSSLNLPICVRI